MIGTNVVGGFEYYFKHDMCLAIILYTNFVSASSVEDVCKSFISADRHVRWDL